MSTVRKHSQIKPHKDMSIQGKKKKTLLSAKCEVRLWNLSFSSPLYTSKHLWSNGANMCNLCRLHCLTHSCKAKAIKKGHIKVKYAAVSGLNFSGQVGHVKESPPSPSVRARMQLCCSKQTVSTWFTDHNHQQVFVCLFFYLRGENFKETRCKVVNLCRVNERCKISLKKSMENT